jgi:hypothetical protein
VVLRAGGIESPWVPSPCPSTGIRCAEGEYATGLKEFFDFFQQFKNLGEVFDDVPKTDGIVAGCPT